MANCTFLFRIVFMIILILTSLVLSVSAKTFSPLELAGLAQERAPIIKMYLEQQNVSESHIKQAKILANPTLTYQGGSLKAGTESGRVTDLTLMQPIPWLGKRSSRIKSQEFLANLSKLDTLETKLLLGHRVYLLTHRLAHQMEMEKYNKQRKERFSLIVKYLSTRPLASPKQSLEKDLIESQIRLVEKTMNELTSFKNGLLNELSLLTGVENLEVSVDWKKLPGSHEESFYSNHLTDGYRMKKANETIRLSENKIDEARVEARPDIMVGVNYRQENVAPANHFYHGQVAIVIPLVDRGQHSVQAARAQLRKDEAGMKVARMDNESELIYSVEAFKAANRGIDLFPLDLLSRSSTRFNKAEDAFKKGQIDVMTFLQSDTQVHENINLVYESRMEYLESLSRLEQLVGHHMEQN